MRAMMIILALGFAACGKKGGDGGGAPPPKPANGAPVAFEAKSWKEGEKFAGEVEIKGYNFLDKDASGYMLLFRYYDDKGGTILIGKGTPFEKDFGFMGLSGRKYSCPAKGWCSMKVSGLDVPAGTKKVDVVAAKVDVEGKPVFDTSFSKWPGEDKKAEGETPTPTETAGSAAGSGEGSAAGSGSAATP
jgi:hypothetical protein